MWSQPTRARSWKQIALTTIALAAAAKVALVLSGILEGSLVADDAYYYFTIARHLASGMGPTFDGLSLTNGFHPLWQLMLVPWYAAFDGLWAPVRAALLTTIALDLFTAWRLLRVARAFTSPAQGWLAMTLWSATPFGLLLGLRGMEGSLNACLVVLVLEVATGGGQREISWRRACAIGALLGLSGLARTDNLVTVGAATVASLWTAGRRQGGQRRLRRDLGCAAATAAIVVAPWFLWSWARFGQWVQVSGQVKRWTDQIYGTLPGGWDSPAAAVSTLAHAVFAPVVVTVRRLGGQEFGSAHSWPWISALLLAGGGLVLILGWTRRGIWRGMAGPALSFVTVYMVAHALLFGVVWRAYADWYAVPTYALLAVALALLADPLAQSARGVRRMTGVGVTVACVGLGALTLSNLLLYPYRAKRPEQRWGPLFDRAAAAWPQGARLGAWDAGMAGYVATSYPGLTVVNLDGLVNNQAFAAVQQGEYLEYLLRTVDVYLQDPRRARMYLDGAQVELLRQRVGGPSP